MVSGQNGQKAWATGLLLSKFVAKSMRNQVREWPAGQYGQLATGIQLSILHILRNPWGNPNASGQNVVNAVHRLPVLQN